tara:strand:+ start:74 stop:301 length:228 start_codon:yes stop_codon:yes gene_type:complete
MEKFKKQETEIKRTLRYGIVYTSEYSTNSMFTHASETWEDEDKVIDLKNALQKMSPKRNYQIVVFMEEEHLEAVE